MLGILGCASPTGADTNASGSASSHPSSVASAASAPAGSARPDASSTPSVQEVEDATFDALLKELVRQTGGGHLGELSPKGLILRKLDADGVLFRVGLRDGDVVEKVNGAAFSQPEEIVDAIGTVMKARRFDVQASRGGAPLTFIVQAKPSAGQAPSVSAGPSGASSTAPGASSAQR